MKIFFWSRFLPTLSPRKGEWRMPAAMKVTQEPDFGPRPVREHGSLILACIVYWQAREISRVLTQWDPVANGVDTSLLEHVSPIEWNKGTLLRL
jgi:Tn3 transposase DDE domain